MNFDALMSDDGVTKPYITRLGHEGYCLRRCDLTGAKKIDKEVMGLLHGQGAIVSYPPKLKATYSFFTSKEKLPKAPVVPQKPNLSRQSSMPRSSLKHTLHGHIRIELSDTPTSSVGVVDEISIT